MAHRRSLLILGVSFVFYALLIILADRLGHGDRNYWIQWTGYLQRNGLTGIYRATNCDYPPIPVYVLLGLGQLFPAELAGQYFKFYPLLFDFAGPLLALRLLGKPLQTLLSWTWPLFNLAYVYNTVIWGQLDSPYTFFAFAAVVLAAQRRFEWSAACLALGFMSKPQTLIFVPLVGVLFLLCLTHLRRLLASLLTFVGTAAAVSLPFLVRPDGLASLWERVFLGVSFRYPTVIVSAYNQWFLRFGYQAKQLSDQLTWNGLTLRSVGLVLFAGTLLSILILLAIRLLRGQARRASARFRELASVPALLPLVLLVGGMIPVLFFFFNTQMHERYTHASMLFLYGFGLLTRRFHLYVGVSFLYLLNVGNEQFWEDWAPAVNAFSSQLWRLYARLPFVVSWGYVVLLGLLGYELVRQTRKNSRVQLA
jgi:hypothetical protein